MISQRSFYIAIVVVFIAGGQRPEVRTVVIDNPQIGSLPVFHDVVEVPDKHDFGAIGRDLRVSRDFQIEQVDGSKAVWRQFGGF